jgi:hypothetical protein
MADRLTRKVPSDKAGLDEEVQARFEKRYRRARDSLIPALVTVFVSLVGVASNIFAAAIDADIPKNNKSIVVGSALLAIVAASVLYYGTIRRQPVQAKYAKYETVSQINDEHLKQLITGIARGRAELDALVTRDTGRVLSTSQARKSRRSLGEGR